MAFVSDLHLHLPKGGLRESVAHKLGNMGESWRKWRLFRRTKAELAGLSDRELADLGLNRSMITSVAHEAVYGRKN